MSDFKTRLYSERYELETRIEKLTIFIETETFGGIDEMQQRLLRIQREAMITYLHCLNERIHSLNNQ